MVELRYSRIIHVIGSWNEKTKRDYLPFILNNKEIILNDRYLRKLKTKREKKPSEKKIICLLFSTTKRLFSMTDI